MRPPSLTAAAPWVLWITTQEWSDFEAGLSSSNLRRLRCWSGDSTRGARPDLWRKDSVKRTALEARFTPRRYDLIV